MANALGVLTRLRGGRWCETSFRGHELPEFILVQPNGVGVPGHDNHPPTLVHSRRGGILIGTETCCEKNSRSPVLPTPLDRTAAAWPAACGKTVKVWDAATGPEILTLKGHTSGAHSVAFSPDGSRLASSGGPTVKVWDAATGQEILYCFQEHAGLAVAARGWIDVIYPLTGPRSVQHAQVQRSCWIATTAPWLVAASLCAPGPSETCTASL